MTEIQQNLDYPNSPLSELRLALFENSRVINYLDKLTETLLRQVHLDDRIFKVNNFVFFLKHCIQKDFPGMEFGVMQTSSGLQNFHFYVKA